MRLFDQINYIDEEFAGYSEPAFKFLNRTTKPEFIQIRDFLEAWFVNYPDTQKHELRSRFRSVINAHHHAAFFELLLHQLFINLGADIEVHPKIPNTSRSPDFLIKLPGNDPFLLEATILTFQSSKETAAKARLNQVYDILDRDVDPTNFFISVDVEEMPDAPPPATKIAKFINDHLKSLDPDEIIDAYQKQGHDAIPKWRFEHLGWSIVFSPSAKKPEARGRIGAHPLGSFMSGWKSVNYHTPMRNAIISKARAYGNIPMPFLIAVNALEILHDDDIFATLFGTEFGIVHFEEVEERKPAWIEPSRKPDGVWTSPKGPLRQNVSGVLFASHLRPWSIGDAYIGIFNNPWAVHPLKLTSNKIQLNIPEEDHYKTIAGLPLNELLRTPWPPNNID